MKAIKENWDLVIIGGGITGAGIFRETVRMDLNVLLVEQKDFAWGQPLIKIGSWWPSLSQRRTYFYDPGFY
jgi:glycine/D-amino acid oxidase-like deaminating enzyme